MKRVVLEATEENILNSIKNNTYNRCADIIDFVKALDLIEGNMFISLDAKWGEGKTFYVRQIEYTLEYLSRKEWGEESEKASQMSPFFEKTVLEDLCLNQSYFPIYYNAWLYDNHEDPLMSLVFTIVKKSEKFCKTKTEVSVGEKILELLPAVAFLTTKLEISFDGKIIRDAFSGNDILEAVKTTEEIRGMVKDILNTVIEERAQRLVIFIDELDRCRPSYAIEMLERLKHYFDDERIIFVISVNKEQLIHTISKYYGDKFDSTGYLNKFFDLNIHMPVNEEVLETGMLTVYSHKQRYLKDIADGLNRYFKLSIRDALIFKQRITGLSDNLVNDTTSQGRCLSLFLPVIAILDLKNEAAKISFLEGDITILESLSEKILEIRELICQLSEQNDYVEGFDNLKKVYNYAFQSSNKDSNVVNKLGISRAFKKICMRLCNGFYE